MLKLMKYEFRKQLFSKGIILAIIAIIEGFFCYYVFTDDMQKAATTIVVGLTIAICVLFFEAIECISTYSNDLKTRQSYMLFMTPHSSYCILGAKVLTMVVTIISSAFIFLLIGFADFNLAFAKFSTLDELYRVLKQFINLDINFSNVTIYTSNFVIGWINFVILAFFAITLSTTFLANRKGKGLVSVVLFFVILYLEANCTDLVQRLISPDSLLTTSIENMLCNVVYATIAYITSAYMLDKKVSL